MEYQNAGRLLPDELLSEVQKYVQGRSLYIPKPKRNHKKWGDNTRSKMQTSARNDEIRALHGRGLKISALAQRYALSPESIKKIVYVKE